MKVVQHGAMFPSHTDRVTGELLNAVRAGSVDALGALYREYGDMVYGLARTTTGSDEEAEDVLQDVFLGLPRALQSYHHRERFESWFKRVAIRTALMRLRALRRKRETSLDEERPGAATPDPKPAPIDRIAIQQAIDRLPEPLRVVFVLKEIEGYSHGEIAIILGLSSGSSATRLSRAWARLRKEAHS